MKVPLQGGPDLKRYANQLAAGINATAARSAKTTSSPAGAPAGFGERPDHALPVVDKAGNAVAVTYTLNTNLGGGIVAKGTGILLNNEMDDFRLARRGQRLWPGNGGEANAVAAGKRPSSMTPTLVLKDGKPTLVTGSPAARASSPRCCRPVVNTIDFGMNWPRPPPRRAFTTSGRPTSCAARCPGQRRHAGFSGQWGTTRAPRSSWGRTQTIQIRDGMLRCIRPAQPGRTEALAIEPTFRPRPPIPPSAAFFGRRAPGIRTGAFWPTSKFAIFQSIAPCRNDPSSAAE